MTFGRWSQNLRRLLAPKSIGGPGRGKGRGKPPGLFAEPCYRKKTRAYTLYSLHDGRMLCVAAICTSLGAILAGPAAVVFPPIGLLFTAIP